MSAEQLSRLSLGDTMVTTRAGAARARSGRPQTPQESLTSSPISPTPSLIESTNGHVYDISTFDEDLRRRAKIGLLKDDNNIRMRFCGETDDAKYFFHLDDDITVKLEEARVPRCSCGAAQEGKTCKHIFWIIGQLCSVLPTNQTIRLAQDGSSVKNTHPAEILQRRPLRDFADHLGWIIENEDLPDTDEIVDEVSNMMSVFEPTGALPAEFKDEDARELSDLSRMYREFVQNTIVQQAIRYPAFFLELKEQITPEFQVQCFFEKIEKRIEGAFKALDEYIEKGPTNARFEVLDVVNCAARLTSLVEKIEEYREDSLVSDAGERRDDHQIEQLASTALVKILDEVTCRNYDAYADSTWGIPSSDPRHNNLFVCLIGPASEDQGFFVLDSLSDVAPEVIRHHIVDLEIIGNRLRNTPVTPPAYLDAFRTLIQDNRKRAASQSAGNSAKRPELGGS